MSLSWSASSDNVGVSGYGVYQALSSVGSTSSTSYTVTGLSCGTSYSLSVDAFDAAGNRSSKSTVSVSTAACSGGGSGATANLWVDTNGGSCARSAGGAVYADGSACASFAAAWSAAQCGDTVGVVAGSYGSQTVSAAKSCSSATPVTFTAAATVSLTGGLDIATSYVSFNGPFDLAKTYNVEQGTSYVSLTGVSTPHAFMMGSHVTITGGQVGPNNVCQTGWEDGLQIWDNGSVSATT